MKDRESEKKPEWPREVWIQPTYETMIAMLGIDDDGCNPSVSDAVLFTMGQHRRCQQIDSWEELQIPDGHELVDEDDSREWEAYRDSKQRGR